MSKKKQKVLGRWQNQSIIEQWDYNDLVDYIEAELLKALLKGEFHDGVFLLMQVVIRWHKGRNK